MPSFTQLALYALFPAAAMFLAGGWAVLRPPGERWRSALMHFAAGVVFAVVAVELLPDLVHQHSVPATALGFGLGTAAMLAVRSLTGGSPGAHEEPAHASAGSLLAATAADISIDGLMLGIGFAAGARQGILLTIALTCEMISLGLAVTLKLQAGSLASRPILLRVSGLSGLFLLAALLGSAALSQVGGVWLAGVIAFGAAALLYLVTEELLTEAHEMPENAWLTSAFFVGFLAVFLLELVR